MENTAFMKQRRPSQTARARKRSTQGGCGVCVFAAGKEFRFLIPPTTGPPSEYQRLMAFNGRFLLTASVITLLKHC